MKERNSNALVCILCMCKGTVTLATKTCNLFCDYFAPGGGGGGGSTSGKSWWGCAARYSKSCPYFRPKNVIFNTRFQTWPQTLLARFQT